MSRRPEVRELCKQLICVDESKRMSTAQALQNPWLQHCGARLRQRKASKDRQIKHASTVSASTMQDKVKAANAQVQRRMSEDNLVASWPLSQGTPFVRAPAGAMHLNRSQSLQGAPVPESTQPFAAQGLPNEEQDLPNLLQHHADGKTTSSQVLAPPLGGVAGPSTSSGYHRA